MRINQTEVKYDRKFGSYFGTMPAEEYDTGKHHFKPTFRAIYVSSKTQGDKGDSFFYITSTIHGSMRLYRHRDWFETSVGNIFAHGKTLKEAVAKFKYNLNNLVYNCS